MCGYPYGNCTSATCERCKPKLVRCPDCAGIAFLKDDTCVVCGALIPEEAKTASIAAWRPSRGTSRAI